jgi:hypothetical protein
MFFGMSSLLEGATEVRRRVPWVKTSGFQIRDQAMGKDLYGSTYSFVGATLMGPFNHIVDQHDV